MPQISNPMRANIVRQHLDRLKPAVIKPMTEWLVEGYLTINLEQIETPGSKPALGRRFACRSMARKLRSLFVANSRRWLQPWSTKSCNQTCLITHPTSW